jgi:predicted flap endonuclease-1-like 5' DNA nuclease
VIWHFLEIWVLIAVAFLLGCVLGTILYRVLSRSWFAETQGAVADAVGDVIDGIKTRFGVGPVWRPELRRVRERPAPVAVPEIVDDEFGEIAATAIQVRLAAARPAPTNGKSVGKDLAKHWDADGLEADTDDSSDWLDDVTVEVEETVVEEIAPRDDLASADDVDQNAMRPMGLPGPRSGIADDLQRIRGIGRRIEEVLNDLGIFHFGQIAAWTPAEARWVGAFLAFPERIERDDWIGQATILASGGSTGYVKGADRRKSKEED